MAREEISNKEWSIFTQQYPIGYKFSAKVLKVKPFGIFVEIKKRPKDPYAALIDIGHSNVCHQYGGKRLPLDYTQWHKKGQKINCVVSYYHEHNRQLGLCWLG